MKMFENPAVIVGLLGALIALALVLKRSRGAAEAPVDRGPKEMEELAGKGRYAEAAALALRHERWNDAMDLYLRAQEPAKAAQVAVRMGNHRVAAELYEKAGDRERAARSYEKAGMTARAKELVAAEQDARKPSGSKGLGAKPQEALDPLSRAKDAERTFREAMAKALRDPDKKAEAQPLASLAAEEFLALGEIARAAAIYRDAEMFDEAIHLYVNVLGQPGEAAALVAACGHHERAAELYELAGQKERAASVWADVARKSPHPEGFLDRVEQLSLQVVRALLHELVGARPVSDASAELHYRYAAVLERSGERAEAARTFGALRSALGSYRDVDAHLKALEKPLAEPPRSPLRDSTRDTQKQTATARVVVQPVLVDRDLPDAEAAAMAHEAATAAVSRVRRSSMPPPMGAPEVEVRRAVIDARGTRAVRSFASGLEDGPLEVGALHDAAVKGAREGPSIDALKKYISGAECSLANIEVFYLLGLAHLAAGDWNPALEALRAVEEASPGYRDAELRVIELERWQKMLGSKVSLVGRAPTTSDVTAGRYQVRGELGRGGMAVVYRAVDQVLGREVALKFLAEHFSAQKEMQEMFQREARSVGQLNHPNIVTIYDFGMLGGRAFIAMEFVEGNTIDQMLETSGRMPVIEALRVIKQVLEALEYAHERQIIHRDIKPSNMMRSSTGAVKLMDFGLAKSLEGGAKSSIVAGTPAYMPPEQFRGDMVDQRADLFAVGASLYEMVSGRLPFASQDRTQRPRPTREIAPAVPDVVDRMLFTAMDPDVSRRFQSAAEFLVPVRRVLAAVDRATGGAEPSKNASDPHESDVIKSLFTPSLIPASSANASPEQLTAGLGTTEVQVPRAASTGSLAELLEPDPEDFSGALGGSRDDS